MYYFVIELNWTGTRLTRWALKEPLFILFMVFAWQYNPDLYNIFKLNLFKILNCKSYSINKNHFIYKLKLITDLATPRIFLESQIWL